MIEKRKRCGLKEPNVRAKVNLRLRELISDSAKEVAALARIQGVLCSYHEVQTYEPFLIDNPPIIITAGSFFTGKL
jgi:hypothetical protein